jgi:hypothetical protein
MDQTIGSWVVRTMYQNGTEPQPQRLDRATADEIIAFLRQRLSGVDVEKVSALLDKCVSTETRVQH